jgi:hypothetical protein
MRVVVVLSNEKDHHRAEKTLEGIRTIGGWTETLVWIALDFEPEENFVRRWNLRVLPRSRIDMSWLWEIRQRHPFKTCDDRETKKLIQFSKWRVFDPYFKKWESLLYIDSGMRIVHPIAPLFDLDHKDRFLAPDDRYPYDDPKKTFDIQWDAEGMPEVYNDLVFYTHRLRPDWLRKEGYFLNCVWLMDTALIKKDTQDELMRLAMRFPISKTNEMAIMNLYFHDSWKDFPKETSSGKISFDWSERGHHPTTDYILLKYPIRS